ncbi:MAG: helix-turn-helix transcriptional regulator [Alphaproteobacteria bacterium]|nr:helix-turn-helix transcriptional regulator [Alphaproteobacteria bacterium]
MQRSFDWLISYETGENETLPSHGSRLDNEHCRAINMRYDLGPNIQLFTHVIDVRRPMIFEPQGDADQYRVCSHVAASGRVKITFPDGLKAKVSPSSGLLFYPAKMRARYDLRAGEHILYAGYSMAPDALVQLLDDEVPSALAPLLNPTRSVSKILPIPVSRPLRMLAKAMVKPGLTGRLLELFLEGSMLQMLSLQVAALRDGQAGGRALTAREERAVREARDRLLADMRTPPRVIDLARSVGLSEKRLSEGFRALYGYPVFEYLKRERLENARLAIENTDVPIKQIAFRIGYSHVTNFTNAFKAQFDKSPSQFRKM